MVDVVGGLRVEVSEGVVAHRGQVDNGVEAEQVLTLDVANVGSQGLDPLRGGTEGAGLEDVQVEPDDLVAGPVKRRGQDRADVAVVAGDQYAQGASFGEVGRAMLGRPPRMGL